MHERGAIFLGFVPSLRNVRYVALKRGTQNNGSGLRAIVLLYLFRGILLSRATSESEV